MGELTSYESVVRASIHSYKSDLDDVLSRHAELMSQLRIFEENSTLDRASYLSEFEEAKDKFVLLRGRNPKCPRRPPPYRISC